MRVIALICAFMISPLGTVSFAADAGKKTDAGVTTAKLKAPATAEPAKAAAPAPAAKAEEEEGSTNAILEYLNKGGWMMWVILMVSIIGVAIFFERGFHLFIRRRIAGGVEGFVDRVIKSVELRLWDKAKSDCKLDTEHPAVATMRAGLDRANRAPGEIEKAMEKEMIRALPPIEKRIGLLSFLANSCTLLGLLGTIFGLIQAFSAVSAASAAERSTALAAGISTAMYTTAFGIVVAVPLLFFHHLLTTRQEEIINEMELGATALMVAFGKRDAADRAEADPE